MSATRDQVIAALNVANDLKEHGFSVIIAGGFCRDVYFGVEPKDIDIVVAAGSIHDDPAEAHAILSSVLTNIGVEHLGFRMYTESKSDRLVGGFKCTGNLDVVLYDVKEATQAVDAFDFNLNQFVLMQGAGFDFDKAYVVYAGDTSWHDLVPVREDFSDDRFARMKEKFFDLTWRYPENQGPARVGLAQRFPKE